MNRTQADRSGAACPDPLTPRVVAETARLVLRGLEPTDAPFVLRLLNEPDFLRFIGDRGVRSVEDARDYIERGPLESYRAVGHGLFLAETRDESAPVGICGLMRKPWLEVPDLAYAFLAEATGQGFASEAARAVIAHARETVQLERLIAVVVPDNERSKRVLRKLGFRREGAVSDPAGVELDRFTMDLRAST